MISKKQTNILFMRILSVEIHQHNYKNATI